MNGLWQRALTSAQPAQQHWQWSWRAHLVLLLLVDAHLLEGSQGGQDTTHLHPGGAIIFIFMVLGARMVPLKVNVTLMELEAQDPTPGRRAGKVALDRCTKRCPSGHGQLIVPLQGGRGHGCMPLQVWCSMPQLLDVAWSWWCSTAMLVL